MAKTYEVMCDYFTDAHDKKNGIIGRTDILLETEDEQEALNEYEYRKAQEGELENVYMWMDVDGIGEPYKKVEA